MEKKIILYLVLFFTANYPAFGSQQETRWGGPGYDPALKGEASSRFTIRPQFNNIDVLDILVDTKETVQEVGHMDLIGPSGVQLTSQYCHKAMKHITAPWACGFTKDEMQRQSGEGEIKIFDRFKKFSLLKR